MTRKKTVRFKIGIGLLIVYPVLLLSAAISAFVPLDAGVKVAVTGGLVAVAEGLALLGIALVGKETYQAIKAKLRRKRPSTRAAEPTSDA